MLACSGDPLGVKERDRVTDMGTANSDLILKGLNPSQMDATTTLEGPLLILAGAGSGKTRVLTHRVANLILQGKAAPDQILAVTFTNKAAREMESRIFKILSDLGFFAREPLWVSTFHSFCVRILKDYIHLLDYKPGFVIYDDSDQLSMLKKVLLALNINEKLFPAKTFRGRINNAKMLALAPADIAKSNKLFMDQKTLEVFTRYEQDMKKSNALDFGDLLVKVYDLFRMYPDILDQLQEKFLYILVDEYQDTNHIQYLLVHMLAKKHRNLCVVGDEDQSIYSWRGADIANILDFEKDFSDAKIIKLEENYRSTHTIVTAATKVISNNTERKDKTLFTNNESGDRIEVREERNEYDEARYAVRTIQSLVNSGETNYSECALFYRTNAQSRVLEEQLRSSGIPYKLVGGVRFYERMEVKDILSYMKLSLNPSDDVALKRVINTPARGIGKTTLEKIETLSNEQGVTMLKAAEWATDNRVFNAGTTSKVRGFVNLMTDLTKLSQDLGLLDFFQILLDKTEYVTRLKAEESIEAESRIQNLEELGNALTQFAKERPDSSLQTFLEEMALVSDVDGLDESQESVTLMTLHVSKGLEYPYVFIVGLEENLFPSHRSDDEDDEHSLEEERRLCYVGMTRARKKLFLTHARTRKVWGQEQVNPPSRFLNEIPENLINRTSAIDAPRFVVSQSRSGAFGTTSSFKDKIRNYSQSEDESQSFPDYDSQSSEAKGYMKGMKVRHPTFGGGTIFQIEGSGDQQKISVLFADQTIKKFVAKYARLERL